MAFNLDLILRLPDAVCEVVVLVVPLVAEELPGDSHAAEVTPVLITAVLTIVPVRVKTYGTFLGSVLYFR